MSDNLTKKVRSYNMSQIRSENTKPECIVRKYLFSKGLRYRKNDKRYPGKPDILLPRHKTVIFVNGCFWHMHENCQYFVMPKTNVEYWQTKLERNRERDLQIYDQYVQMKWNVIVVWECELISQNRKSKLDKIYEEIVGFSKK